MATIGEVGAKSEEISPCCLTQDSPLKLYFGVFFDGTSNNMIQSNIARRIKQRNIEKIKKNNKGRSPGGYVDENDFEVVLSDEISGMFEDGTNRLQMTNGNYQKNEEKGYSNIAILHSIYQGTEKGNSCNTKIFNIYVEGAGTTYESDSKLAGPIGSLFGKGETGVTKLVQKAMDMVSYRMTVLYGENVDVSNSEVHFHVFGFSRGATEARLFSYCVANDSENVCLGVPEKYVDGMTHKFIFWSPFLKRGLKLENITVDILGIFDTVSSIGGFSTESYANNVTDFGLYSPTFRRVKNVMHLCALDEFRSHFAITDIGAAIDKGPEIFMPGCHSDVGGGYIDGGEDFMINIAYLDMISGDRRMIPDRIIPFLIPSDNITSAKVTNYITFEEYINSGFLVNGKAVNRTVPGFNIRRKDGAVISSPSIKRDITKLHISRVSKRGYSNTPLRVMKDYSTDKCPACLRKIPVFFKENERVKRLIGVVPTNKGRHFIYPGGSFTSRDYNELREYLHISAKDSIGFEMSLENNIVRRYLYRGENGDQTRHFVSFYNQP